jgi:hypothetical protein
MPRTFSLQRLMLAITLLCIACSIGVAYPLESLAYVLLVSLFIPTVIVCQVLVSLSSPTERMTTMLIALSGAFLGFMFAFAPVPSLGGSMNVWRAIQSFVLPMTICPTLGAIILGSASLADDLLRRRQQRPPTANDK